MKALRLAYVGIMVILIGGSLMFALQLFAEQGIDSHQNRTRPNEQPPTVAPPTAAAPPTATIAPPPGTDTPTPAGQFFAPAVFDTASTATLTPVPTSTSLYTATPAPTTTFPPP